MTKEEMFNNNIKIAYKIANTYLINYSNEIDDIRQLALLGLWKAVLTYDETKKSAFSTYAYVVIYNEINLYLRKKKKSVKTYSINEVIIEDDHVGLTLEDMIEDKKDFVDDVILKVDTEHYINNLCKDNIEKEVLRYTMNKKTQKYISDKVGVSQPQVSRIKNRIKKRLSKIINGNEIIFEKKQITKQTKIKPKKEPIVTIKVNESHEENSRIDDIIYLINNKRKEAVYL